MIKEQVIVKEQFVIIKVEYKERKYANQPKLIHSGEVTHLIPDEFLGKIKLVESPSKELSNIKSANFSLSGEWKFEIIKKQTPQTNIKKANTNRKPATRRTSRKKTLTNKK